MKLIPQPQKMELKKGEFYIDDRNSIVLDISCGVNVLIYAKQLQDDIKKWCGVEVAIKRGQAEAGDILLQQEENLAINDSTHGGYTIRIQNDGVVITGCCEELLLNGIQTLRQMYAQSGCMLPCLWIEDYPEMVNRGFYHDITRGRVPTLEELKKLVDDMCYYKLNQLQLYVEHTYLFRECTELWRDETPLTAQEILELDDYCYERHVELIPSLASFGHMYKLLRTKQCRDFCERDDLFDEKFSFWSRMSHHTINVSNPEGIEFIKSMIEEYMSLFRSKYFNICADETYDLCKGRSAHLLEKQDEKDVYTKYVGELSRFVLKKGKTPMYWGDIICNSPEKMKNLPKENICLNWGYAANQREDETKKIYEAGAVQYICPGVSGWNQWINLFEDSYENITRMCTYAKKYQAIGVLNTDWGDYGHVNQPEFSRPGMIYGAAFSWNTKILPFADINESISVVEFHDMSGKAMSILAQIAKNEVFSWGDAVRYYESCYLRETPEEINPKEVICSNLDIIKEKMSGLSEVRNQLQKVFSQVDSSKRYLLQKYLIAIDGMLLWAKVKALVAKVEYGEENDEWSGIETAAELERWFMRYKKEWRKVSREGDLAHISEIIFWYADKIRMV